MTTKFQPQMVKSPPFTVEVAGSQPVEGETIPRRNTKYKDALLTTPEEGISTVHDIVTRAAAKFGDAKCMGTRPLLKTHHETQTIKKVVNGAEEEVEKIWDYSELGPYEYITFKEYAALTLDIGAGLRTLGLGKTDRILLYAGTR